MKILAFEASAKAASAALLDDKKLVASAYQNNKLTHSETLLPLALSMLNNADYKISDIDMFAVSVGPGSFTGLRIGISLVKGLSFALDKPCVGVSTLEALAYNQPRGNYICCPVMDARAGQVYNALFDMSGEKPLRIIDDRAISAKDIDIKDNFIFCGDGAYLFQNVSCAPERLLLQHAYGVGLAALEKTPCEPDMLLPCYLRLPQAERERLKRSVNQ